MSRSAIYSAAALVRPCEAAIHVGTHASSSLEIVPAAFPQFGVRTQTQVAFPFIEPAFKLKMFCS
jgi:hypothetical protein